MSGICDTCQRLKRIGCGLAMDGLETCDLYERESNYEKLFGTPERAARTTVMLNNCRVVGCLDCAARGACRYDGCGDDYDALLEWLRGDAE